MGKAVQMMRRFLDELVGLPPHHSYTWGGHIAPLAAFLFILVASLRAISPLQWIKYARRKLLSPSFTTNLRADFPATYTELYFLTVLACAVALRVCQTHGVAEDLLANVSPRVFGLARGVGWVLVIECGVWVIYYLNLRHFIEGRYTAYHRAEYLLEFPVVVLAQVTLIAVITDHDVFGVIDAVRGNAQPDYALSGALGVLGLIYAAVIVASLVNSLPVIQSRRPERYLIVGGGEVVGERIIPALVRTGVPPTEINVFDLADPTDRTSPAVETIQGVRLERLSQDQIFKRLRRESLPTIVATPTPSHLLYVELLAAEDIPFAVEKPVCWGPWELGRLEQNPSLFDRGFCLAYYALEKALPLTYFLTQREVYREYLEGGDNGPPASGSEVSFLLMRLGALQAIEITLLEDASKSPRGAARRWTEEPHDSPYPLIETAVHPLHLIAALLPKDADMVVTADQIVLRRYGPRDAEAKQQGRPGIAPTFVSFQARAGDVAIDVQVAKFAATTQRALRAGFENGELRCDFDSRSLQVYVGNGAERKLALEIAVKPGLQHYDVQMRQFQYFLNHGWYGIRHDELANQLRALRLWNHFCDVAKHVVVTPQ